VNCTRYGNSRLVVIMMVQQNRARSHPEPGRADGAGIPSRSLDPCTATFWHGTFARHRSQRYLMSPERSNEHACQEPGDINGEK
jgi:hypothetical protein